MASKMGHKGVVDLLLTEGADSRAADCDQVTALHMAAEMGHKEVAELLIDGDPKFQYNRPDLDTKDHEGCTALHKAVKAGHEEIVELLFNRGADMEAEEGGEGLCIWLLQKATIVSWNSWSGWASPSIRGTKGRMLLLAAVAKELLGIVQKLLKVEGIDLESHESQDYEGNTPLSLAKKTRFDPAIKLLEQHIERCNRRANPYFARGAEEGLPI
ncbi:MAG: hypothetical protein M1840_005567, partial [Geoglossum simile]